MAEKKSITLIDAAKGYLKDLKEGRHMRQFEARIAETLEESIFLAKNELSKAKRNLGELREYQKEQYLESLLGVLKYPIETPEDRNNSAEKYLKDALAYGEKLKAGIKEAENSIKNIQHDLNSYSELKAQLVTIAEEFQLLEAK